MSGTSVGERIAALRVARGLIGEQLGRALGIAGDPAPTELTRPDESRRVPPRLLAAAQQGYQNGRVGLGLLAALLDEDADSLYLRLASDGVVPPAVRDDMADL